MWALKLGTVTDVGIMRSVTDAGVKIRIQSW